MKSKSLKASQSVNSENVSNAKAGEASASGSPAPAEKNKSYPVGYKRPPIERQFKKGVSGNPLGRPRKLKSSHARMSASRILRQVSVELERPYYDPDLGFDTDETMISIAIRKAISDAAMGDPRAFQNVTNFLSKMKAIEDKEKKSEFDAAIKYKKDKEAEIKACQKANVTFDYIIPHPDHIFIDHEGYVQIIGPRDLNERQKWDHFAQERKIHIQRVDEISEHIKKGLSSEDIKGLENRKRLHLKRIDGINDIIPAFYTEEHVKEIYAQDYKNEEHKILRFDPRDLSDEERAILGKMMEKAIIVDASETEERKENFEPSRYFNQMRRRH